MVQIHMNVQTTTLTHFLHTHTRYTDTYSTHTHTSLPIYKLHTPRLHTDCTHFSPLNGKGGLCQGLVTHPSELLVTMTTEQGHLSGYKGRQLLQALQLTLLLGTHIVDHMNHLIC